MGHNKRNKQKKKGLKEIVESLISDEGIIPSKQILDVYHPTERVAQYGLQEYTNYLSDIFQLSLAYGIASLHHSNQPRKEKNPRTGQPYPFMQHLTSVAYILAHYGYNLDTAIAGLFHDSEDRGGQIDQIGPRLETSFSPVVSGVAYICADDHNGRKKAKTDQKEDFLLKFLTGMWGHLEAVPVKLADRLHNMWSFETYDLPQKIRILHETRQYYLPLAKHFDDRLYEELVGLTNHYLKDPDLSMFFQNIHNYDEIRYRLYNYAAIRSREDITGLLDKNDSDTMVEIEKWGKEAKNSINSLTRNPPDLPMISPNRMRAWAKGVAHTAIEIIEKKRVRNLLENYFERDASIPSTTPETLEFGLQSIPRIPYLDAVAKLRKYGATEIVTVEYGPNGYPVVERVGIDLFETPEKLPSFTRKIIGGMVNCITEEVCPRSMPVIELSDKLRVSGLEPLGIEVYTSVMGEKVPYLKIQSSDSPNLIIQHLRSTLGISNPMLSYERLDSDGSESIRFVFDVLKADPKVIVQTGFKFYPYLVVDVVYKK